MFSPLSNLIKANRDSHPSKLTWLWELDKTRFQLGIAAAWPAHRQANRTQPARWTMDA